MRIKTIEAILQHELTHINLLKSRYITAMTFTRNGAKTSFHFQMPCTWSMKQSGWEIKQITVDSGTGIGRVRGGCGVRRRIHTYKHVHNWELRGLFHFLWQLLPIRECGAITAGNLPRKPSVNKVRKQSETVSDSWPMFGLTNCCKIPTFQVYRMNKLKINNVNVHYLESDASCIRQRLSGYCVWMLQQGQCHILQEHTEMYLH